MNFSISISLLLSQWVMTIGAKSTEEAVVPLVKRLTSFERMVSFLVTNALLKAPPVPWTMISSILLAALLIAYHRVVAVQRGESKITRDSSSSITTNSLGWSQKLLKIVRVWIPLVAVSVILLFTLPSHLIGNTSSVGSPRSILEAVGDIPFPVWETFQSFDHNYYEAGIQSTLASEQEDQPSSFSSSLKITDPLQYKNGVWYTSTVPIQQFKFRGINLPAKTPLTSSSDTKISFIDRPIPLDTAHEHFQRLSNYGINLLRLTVTWEAVMHAGPGKIDVDYLTYLSQLVDIASEYGLYILLDPHQDVWSRRTGGDGAPDWTMDVAGFQIYNDNGEVKDWEYFHEIGCAWIHPTHRHSKGDTSGNDEIHMGWPTNYGRLVTATMFTLFFAGDEYAPNFHVKDDFTIKELEEGETTTTISIQSFLQKYYLQYLDSVAQEMKDKPNIIGFNSLNEPSKGMVGIPNLETTRTFPAPLGHVSSFFDQMKLGAGQSLAVEYFPNFFVNGGVKVLNPNKLSVWKSREDDVWLREGVYEIIEDDDKKGAAPEFILHKPHYFQTKKNKNGDDDFMEKSMVPFYKRVQETVSQHNQRFVVYAEPFIDLMNTKVEEPPEGLDSNKFGWSPHWYDFVTVAFKRYLPWVGIDVNTNAPVIIKSFIDNSFRQTFAGMKKMGAEHNLHILLGETGVPYNSMDYDTFSKQTMQDKIDGKNKAYGDYVIENTMAVNRGLQAIEKNDLDYILWNYSHDTTLKTGDHWNGEDFSIRSDSENRGLMAVVRPFVLNLGDELEVVTQQFDPSLHSKLYTLIVQCKSQSKSDGVQSISSGSATIYLPRIHFQKAVLPSNAAYDSEAQRLTWTGLTCKKQNQVFELRITNGEL